MLLYQWGMSELLSKLLVLCNTDCVTTYWSWYKYGGRAETLLLFHFCFIFQENHQGGEIERFVKRRQLDWLWCRRAGPLTLCTSSPPLLSYSSSSSSSSSSCMLGHIQTTFATLLWWPNLKGPLLLHTRNQAYIDKEKRLTFIIGFENYPQNMSFIIYAHKISLLNNVIEQTS